MEIKKLIKKTAFPAKQKKVCMGSQKLFRIGGRGFISEGKVDAHIRIIDITGSIMAPRIPVLYTPLRYRKKPAIHKERKERDSWIFVMGV